MSQGSDTVSCKGKFMICANVYCCDPCSLWFFMWGNTHYILWSTHFDRGFFSHVGGKKNKKINLTSQIFFSYRTFFCRFCLFFDRNITDLVKKIYSFWHFRGKSKKNTPMSVFFSHRAHFQVVGGIVDQRI